MESYVFNVKQALDEAGDKLTESENSCKRKCSAVIQCRLDNNSLVDKEGYEYCSILWYEFKLKEIQKSCSAFMMKSHG